MTGSSQIRNFAVFSSLAVLLAAMLGCPREQSAPSASSTPAVEAEKAGEPAAEQPAAASSARDVSNEPSQVASEHPSELPLDPPVPGETSASLTESPRRVVQEPVSPRGGSAPSVTPPPANSPPAASASSPASEQAEPIELFAPRNGSAAAQAPLQQSYAAEQAVPQQPLFEGWPKPLAALVLTGRQHGYIEPCGCTGLANQKGGMARRHTMIKQLSAKGWPVVPIDAGNQVRRFGRQAEIKFQMTATAMRTIGYRAVGLGPDDLRLSFGELVAPVLEEGPDGGSMFVSANVNLLDQTPAYRIVEVAGKKIGITTVLNKEGQQQVNAPEIEFTDPAEAIAGVLPKLQQANCDLLILLAQATEEECAALASKFPQFQIVVSADSAGEPGHDFLPLEGSKARLVKIGAKGMHAVVIGLYDDRQKPYRYQRVPLDDRFADSPQMLELMASYQSQLESLGLDGLGLRPVNHPRGAQFVGSAKCAECHDAEYEIWEKSPHSHATESLVHPGERTEIPRHFDPECLSCHVTGWNAQGYYPYESGYLDLQQSMHLHGNGCENCHGPGSQHVAVELGELTVTDDEQTKLREAMRLTLADAKKNQCLTCHDLDNSPDFHKPGAFEEYWKRIEH